MLLLSSLLGIKLLLNQGFIFPINYIEELNYI